MADSISKLARRIDRLERGYRNLGSTPQLPYSSIDDGYLSVVIDDTPTMIIGEQHDGTTGAVVVVGPTPPVPTAPIITTDLPGGLSVTWDGTFEDDAVAPMDFARVTCHAVPLEDGLDDFDPLITHLAKSSISVATGGEMFIQCDPGVEMLIVLVSWSTAGKFSEPSSPSTGTALLVGLDVNDPDYLAALAAIEAATTAAADAQSAADLANAAALDAASAADAAGIVAAGAVTDAAAAHAAAVAAAAAANAAGVIATSAQESADGKSKIIYATYAPSNEPNTGVETWFHRSSVNGRIVGQYRGTGGTSWAQEQLDGLIIANIDAGKITFGTMSGERIAVGTLTIGHVANLSGTVDLVSGWRTTGQTTINGGMITADSILAGAIAVGQIASTHIVTAGLDAGVIKFGQMSGDRILANTIASNHIVTAGLDAGVIKFGTMSGDRILANTIVSGHIATAGLDAGVIKFGTMSGARITAGTITATQLSADAIDGKVITSATFRTSAGNNRIQIGNAGLDRISGYWSGSVVGYIESYSGGWTIFGDIGHFGTFTSTEDVHASDLYADSLNGGGLTAASIGGAGKVQRTTSSLRYKEVLRAADLDRPTLRALSAKIFRRLDEGPNGREYLGLIAEEVEAAGADHLVFYNDDGQVEGVHYDALAVAAVSYCQQLEEEFTAKHEALAARVEELAAQISA